MLAVGKSGNDISLARSGVADSGALGAAGLGAVSTARSGAALVSGDERVLGAAHANNHCGGEYLYEKMKVSLSADDVGEVTYLVVHRESSI